MKIRIRKMTDADINSVAEIHRQTFPNHKTLSADVECVISELYSADEVLMIDRNVNAMKT